MSVGHSTSSGGKCSAHSGTLHPFDEQLHQTSRPCERCLIPSRCLARRLEFRHRYPPCSSYSNAVTVVRSSSTGYHAVVCCYSSYSALVRDSLCYNHT